MDLKFIEAMSDALAPVIADCIKAGNAPLAERLKAIETKAGEIESRLNDIHARLMEAEDELRPK